MDDPQTLNKYFSCFNHFFKTAADGEKVITIQFDVHDYFMSACEIFVIRTK